MSNYTIGTAGEQVVVEPKFKDAMKEFAELHQALSEMPQDPKDKLSGLNMMLTDLGVDVGTDYSMILMAGMEKAALGAIMADSAVSMAIDVATSAFSQSRDDKYENAKPSMTSGTKNTSKRASVKSVFDRYRKPAASVAAKPKKRGCYATSLLMAGSRKSAAPTIQQIKRRQELKGRMAKVGNDLRDLAILKAMGVEYATRMDVFDAAIGQKRSMLVQTFAGQKSVLTAERKKATLSQDNSPQPRQDNNFKPQRLVMGF